MKKALQPITIKEPRILIYDDEYMDYRVGRLGTFGSAPEPPIEITGLRDNTRKYIPAPTASFECTVSNYEELENIKLDETTMRRIAKFNKEIDIQKLDKKIKEKEAKIKELDDILQDKEGRIDKLKKFVAELYDIDLSDEDDEDYDYYDD